MKHNTVYGGERERRCFQRTGEETQSQIETEIGVSWLHVVSLQVAGYFRVAGTNGQSEMVEEQRGFKTFRYQRWAWRSDMYHPREDNVQTLNDYSEWALDYVTHPARLRRS